MRPQRTGKHSAIGNFGYLPTGAIEAFGLHRFGQAGLASVHPKKQGVQLRSVFLDVIQSFFDFLPKTARWRHKAGRFIAFD
jgi:hypothetical protein